MKLNNRGSWSLIGLLVAVVIVAILAVVLFCGKGNDGAVTTAGGGKGLLDPHSKKKTIIGKSMDTAKATACRNQLDQIRKGILAYKAESGTEANPPDFRSLRLGVSMVFFQCPMSDAPYTYDRATGTVRCPTHVEY